MITLYSYPSLPIIDLKNLGIWFHFLLSMQNQLPMDFMKNAVFSTGNFFTKSSYQKLNDPFFAIHSP